MEQRSPAGLGMLRLKGHGLRPQGHHDTPKLIHHNTNKVAHLKLSTVTFPARLVKPGSRGLDPALA